MPFVPKNANKILKDRNLQKEFFLKPFGLDTPKNMNFPKKHPQYKFFQNRLILQRPGKQLQKGVLAFKTNPRYSKPQIKQYFEKLYGVEVQKVNTARFMGKVYMTMDQKIKYSDPWKKAYIFTKNAKIHPFLNTSI